MTIERIDTEEETSETPEAEAAQAAETEGSKGGEDSVSKLTSRLNGQTAKVGVLTNEKKTLEAQLAEARAEVKALRDGTVSADEAAKAEVAAAKAELEEERRARRTESLKSRFPETFEVLGDAAFALDESALAANEARLLGETGGEEPPTPLRHQETRSTSTKKDEGKAKTAADYAAELEAMPTPW